MLNLKKTYQNTMNRTQYSTYKCEKFKAWSAWEYLTSDQYLCQTCQSTFTSQSYVNIVDNLTFN